MRAINGNASNGCQSSKKTFPTVGPHLPFGASPISISSSFCGGNIAHVGGSGDPGDVSFVVELNVEQDPYTSLEDTIHSQWFYFRSSLTDSLVEKLPAGKKEVNVRYVVTNAMDTAYPRAWPGSTVCVSTNGKKTWERKLDTSFSKAEGTLSWTHTHSIDEGGTYFAYFEPYTYDRHVALIDKCRATRNVEVTTIGKTLEGRDMELIKVGNGPLKCWINHRQHPGETQASFFAEGLLGRLCGLDDGGSVDGLVSRAREAFTFYVVANMNPDGSANGYLRTNAGGANLNREWCPTGDYDAPTLERSPEVYYVLKKMDEVGVDCFADIHGDEEMPFNFIAGSEGIPNWGPRLRGLQGAFLAAYCRANADMQKEVSYEPDPPKEGNLAICSNQICHRFNCLAFTLEMPYKDLLATPDPELGFSSGRCAKLGASLLDGFMHVKDWLRTDEPFWDTLSDEDAYVRPKSVWEGMQEDW